MLTLAFHATKWLFLFLLGFCLAYVFSASLNAVFVVQMLSSLLSLALVPLVVLTFGTIAIAAFLESIK